MYDHFDTAPRFQIFVCTNLRALQMSPELLRSALEAGSVVLSAKGEVAYGEGSAVVWESGVLSEERADVYVFPFAANNQTPDASPQDIGEMRGLLELAAEAFWLAAGKQP